MISPPIVLWVFGLVSGVRWDTVGNVVLIATPLTGFVLGLVLLYRVTRAAWTSDTELNALLARQRQRSADHAKAQADPATADTDFLSVSALLARIAAEKRAAQVAADRAYEHGRHAKPVTGTARGGASIPAQVTGPARTRVPGGPVSTRRGAGGTR